MGTLHTKVRDQLAAGNQRLTSGRSELIDVLARADGPVTISEILAMNTRLAQSSAYRNLAVLEEAGVVHRVVASDEYARYELTEPHSEHHHHLICTNCGLVQDIPSSPALEKAIDLLEDGVKKSTGFVTDSHRIDLVGRCKNCA